MNNRNSNHNDETSINDDDLYMKISDDNNQDCYISPTIVKSSVFRSLMVNAAKKLSTAQFDSGYIGALSPTPVSFIDLILNDGLFCSHGNQNCDREVDYDSNVGNFTNPHETKDHLSTSNIQFSNKASYQKLDFSAVKSVVDIGSGDGRWLTAFYDKFHCLCFGIELDKNRLEMCRKKLDILHSSHCNQNVYDDNDDYKYNNVLNEDRKRNVRFDKIELILGDFGTFNCSGISVVIVYLSRIGNEIIKEKLERECEKGTLIIVVGVSSLLTS